MFDIYQQYISVQRFQNIKCQILNSLNKMNFLTKICHPKQQHFQNENKSQAYKNMNEFIFSSRNIQKFKQKYQANNQWNHPYSGSSRKLDQYQQNNQFERNKVQTRQFNNSYGNTTMKDNNKLSFKDIPQVLCGQRDKNNLQVYKQLDMMSGQNNRSNMHGYHSNDNSRNYYSPQIQSFPSRSIPYFVNQHCQKQQQKHNHSQLTAKTLLTKQNLQLLKENRQLKKFIQDQYKPMKKVYQKLLDQQEQREFLITKLQWKVKQLAKDIKNNQTQIYTNHTQLYSNNTTPMAKVKDLSKFDSKSQIDNKEVPGKKNLFGTFETGPTIHTNIPVNSNVAYNNIAPINGLIYTNNHTNNMYQNNIRFGNKLIQSPPSNQVNSYKGNYQVNAQPSNYQSNYMRVHNY